ncbi:MAG: bifunctional DedA family/phosphatase PAP2 family protein [Ardenticatenales bacterium]
MLPLLERLLSTYGYATVALGVLIESVGIPLPGETILLVAAAYAGAGHLSVRWVIVAAAVGAIVGDTIGYELGHHGGRRLLERYGRFVRLNERHLARAEGFFARYGDKTVFFGRFISILRMFSAFLAGVYRMPYRRFLAYNAAGGILWALTFGLLGAAFGTQWPLVERWAGRAGLLIVGLLLVVALAAVIGRWAVQHESELEAHWTMFWASRRVAALRRRFAPHIAFLQARLSPAGYLGLQLTVGLVVIVAASWLFAGIAEDVVHLDPIVSLDLAVNTYLSARTEPRFTSAMSIVSLGGGPSILVLGVLVAIYLLWRRRWADTLMLLVAAGGGEVLALLLKAVFVRPRPFLVDPLQALKSYSFPSQHAMGSIVFYGLMGYLIIRDASSWRRRVATAVAVPLIVALIGFSRIYLGVHYVSDVLGGYAAGIAWLACTISGVETVRRRFTRPLDPASPPPSPPARAADPTGSSPM